MAHIPRLRVCHVHAFLPPAVKSIHTVDYDASGQMLLLGSDVMASYGFWARNLYHERPCELYLDLVLGAVISFLEPLCGHLSPKVDFKVDFGSRFEGPCVDPLASQYGTYETVTARFWPWLSGKRHCNPSNGLRTATLTSFKCAQGCTPQIEQRATNHPHPSLENNISTAPTHVAWSLGSFIVSPLRTPQVYTPTS